MKGKQCFCFYMFFVLIVCFFCSCRPDASTNTTTSAEATNNSVTEETVPETEARLPMISENEIQLYYDDYLPISKLVDRDANITITDQQVTSTAVGSENADSAVVYFHKEKNCLIAVGTGTAVVTVNDTAYQVTVSSAPISLFMITGHSIGEGRTGNASESVLCADGQAYSMYGAKAVEDYIPGTGIGFAAAQRPKEIDAFTAAGDGTIGEGAALAWQWNNLTGEKVWVLNAAVGGTCLPEWTKGQTAYENAVKLFSYAQNVLSAEIKAGHYRLKDMAIIYHSAANFDYKQVTYTNEQGQSWYDSLWNGLKTDLAMDMDGDGDTETVQAMGFVPIWLNNAFDYDKPANYFMAACDQYTDIFMASLAGKGWLSDGDLAKNFPKIEYSIRSGELSVPTTSKALYSDGVHYIQVAYNALGLDISDNLYRMLRTLNEPVSFEIKYEDGNKVYDEITLKKGKTVSLIPFVQPISANDLTFSVTDNLQIEYPLIIKAVVSGTGTLTASYKNEVLTTVTIEVME